MGKPMFPMISGIVEMVLRVAVIVAYTEEIGFVATSYAEIAAWVGALLINSAAFAIFLRSKLNEDIYCDMFYRRKLRRT